MKIKLTPNEAEDMLNRFAHPHFTNTTNYITLVEVDPDWVAEILPPPLKPAEPLLSIALSEGAQFHGLVMGVQAKYGDIVGDWGIAYVMDTDLGVIYGRECLAEPKKLGVTTTEITDGKFVGAVSRWGEELVRVEADVLGESDEPFFGDGMDNFHFKYSVKADGSGIEDPDLILSHFDIKAGPVTLMKSTKVQLTASPFDVYGEIPLGNPKASFFSKLDMVGSAKYLAKVSGKDFLPWAFFKHDDYRLTMDVV